VKRGVFLRQLYKTHHMGHVEYSPFSPSRFEKPYIKRSLYGLYVQEEAPSLCEGRAAEDGL